MVTVIAIFSSFLFFSIARGKKFGCGGVLISDRYVLTSAYCLRPSSFQLHSVRLGEYDLRTDRDCIIDDPKLALSLSSSRYCNDKTIEIGIENRIVHESYRNLRGPSDFDSRSHDVGLLRLVKSVEFTDFVKPICLPARDVGIGEGKYLASGWGAMPNTDHPKSDLKRVFRLNFADKKSCDGIYGKSLQEDVMCATPKSSNVGCLGDFGGPLMVVDKKSRITVIGIYQPMGTGYCWSSNVPNTYTDVRQYSDWITTNMRP